MNRKLTITMVIIISLVIIVALCMVIKNKQNITDKDAQMTTFSIKYNNVEIVPGTEFAEDAIKEEYELSEIPSCAFDGIDKVYTYSNVEIIVAEIEGKNTVYSVYFLNDEEQTEEGIKISDSKELMIEKYGEQYEQTLENKYTYVKGKVELSFIIENEIITSIEYTLKTY